jgi:4-alpha-glucanotransferase
MKKRLTGVAVPLGALYTKDNSVIGEFGDLKPFADFCKAAGISIIQLLPVNDTGTQSSPYSGLSAFALHPIYIRLSEVPGFDALYKSDAKFKKAYDDFIKGQKYTLRYNYDAILNGKNALLKMLYDATDEGKTGEAGDQLSKWIRANGWVKAYAVYKNLKWNYMQASWKTWLDTDRLKTKEEITALWNKKAFKKEHLFYA